MDPSLVRGSRAGGPGRYDGRSAAAPRGRSPVRPAGGPASIGLKGRSSQENQAAQTPLPQFGHDSRSSIGSEPHAPAGGAAAAVRGMRSGLPLAADGDDADEQSRLLDDLQYKTGPQHAAQLREKHLRSVAVYVAVPWSIFIFTELVTSLLPSRTLACALALLCLLLSVVLVQVYRQSKSVFYLHLSVLVALAVAVASVCGSIIYDRSAVNYWMSRNRISHTDVNPSEEALAYTDAAAIGFTKGTRIDTRRSFGLRGLDSDGYTFCVAPIMDRALAERKEVHFWAVGRDCCEPLTAFRCGQALKPSVREGVVVAAGGGTGSSWAAFKYQQYSAAAQQAAAIYHLTMEQRPVFIWWTTDPESAVTSSLDDALAWAALLGFFYLLVSLLLAGGMFWQAVHGRQFAASKAAVWQRV